jgi:hypothetical protein
VGQSLPDNLSAFITTAFFREVLIMKKKITKEWIYLLCVFVLVAAACNMPSAIGPAAGTATAAASVDPGTSIAETVLASLGQTSQVTVEPVDQPGTAVPNATPTFTLEPSTTPTATLIPTNTPTITLTPLPCNRAEFVSDITIPDNTEIKVNNSFTKIWRLKNTGTCTWTSSYQVTFVSGDQMGASANVSMTSGAIAPGGTADVSITLTAPSSAGTYRGDFKLRAADGTVFGIGQNGSGSFFVQIKAIKSTETPSSTLPDLIITEIKLSPSSPTAGNPVHVKVSVYNQGYGKAKNFIVTWWGLKTFADPSCVWTINTSLGHDQGVVKECDFTFSSWYAPNQKTMAEADTNNNVDESNEDNNVRTQNITVKP